MAEKALSMLRQQHKSASQYVAMLDNTVDDLNGSQNMTEAEVDCILELRGEQAVKSLEAQLMLWKRYLGKDRDLMVRPRNCVSPVSCGNPCTISPVRNGAMTMHGICRMSTLRSTLLSCLTSSADRVPDQS